ncbi:glycosyltransferase family 4 protein [Tardiphaga sp. 604_B6_N1_1]|uniref:glycosyltransferase family 4 protein n=1 Tax=Tardiphaga sp. 604_B6_N1_1 TaxID=3240779 RepID=UPI003F2256E8
MSSIRIAIEMFEDARWLGGSIYIENLLSALSALPQDERPEVAMRFLSDPTTPLAQRLRAFPVTQTIKGSSRLLARARRLQRAVLRRAPALTKLWPGDRDEVFFPVFDASLPSRRNLYWIPDFQPLRLPDLFDADERRVRKAAMAAIARTRGTLVLSSHAALDDFRTYFPDATVRPVVWTFCSTLVAGSTEQAQLARARHQLSEKFLYVANHFWRHKDHATLFEALHLLRQRGLVIPVVCTGLMEDRRAPDHVPALRRRVEQWELDEQICFLGLVSRAEQVELFRMAAAVVQPSRFEGWSTVIEDARALGRPVIASDIPVHVEQLADYPGSCIFPVSDPAGLASALADAWPKLASGPDLVQEEQAAARLVDRRLERARAFVTLVQSVA